MGSPNIIKMSKPGKLPENYQMEDFVSDPSFVNYFFGNNTADTQFWENWLLLNPGSSAAFAAAKQLLQDLTFTISEVEFETEQSRIKAAIQYYADPVKGKTPGIARLLEWKKSSRPAISKRNRSTKYALTFFVVCILGLGIFWLQFIQQKDAFVEKYNRSSNPIVFGLADGTVITLAAQSMLKYPAVFDKAERNVYLDGEAQFHVSKDPQHPFKVHEGELVATVLGTVFNVKKMAGDSVMLVELINGRLKVENIDKAGQSIQSIILNPDERVVYNRSNKKLFKESWQSKPDAGTAESNHIVFERSDFNEIARKLKKVFGVTVLNQSQKRKWSFSGEFENTTAKEIVESICLVEGLHSQINGDTIIIK